MKIYRDVDVKDEESEMKTDLLFCVEFCDEYKTTMKSFDYRFILINFNSRATK